MNNNGKNLIDVNNTKNMQSLMKLIKINEYYLLKKKVSNSKLLFIYMINSLYIIKRVFIYWNTPLYNL